LILPNKRNKKDHHLLNNKKILFYFHEEPLGIIKLDASSREAGQDSGINQSVLTCQDEEI